MTPQELREIAAAKDAEGKAAIERGDAEAAAVAYHQANTARAAASRMESLGGKSLPRVSERSTIHGNVELSAEHRLAIAAGHKAPSNSLKKAAKDAGYTLAGLARAVRAQKRPCSSALLTMAFNGDRPMPAKTAEVIQRLTGFPVHRWPRLS